MAPSSSSSSPNQTVVVSYSASPPFLSTQSWSQIQPSLRAQFPLRNIHWKSATRTSLRTIQKLDVTLTNLELVRDEHTSQIPGNLLEKPLLNIYFANCEDNDVETYRTSIKRHAKEWHSTVTARKNQEWLIIQVVKHDAKAPGGTFFQLKGSVLDKLRADFNSDKRERCLQLTWSYGQDSPIVWGEIMNKLKDGLLSAFESAILQREDEVRRSESQRLMPGWNFCTFFILKESLASSFRSMSLLSEALLQYDELEASFFQVLTEKNLSWFGTLITPTPRDDSGALLSISRKPYRDLILANTISVFDFRIYLLARQCELLARMNRLSDACRRTVMFLGAFGRRLREVQDTLPRLFVESWTYSSALSTVDQCTKWETELQPDKAQLLSVYAGKGELLELARKQLDVLGIEKAYLPAKPPFSNALPSSEYPTSASSDIEISNTELLSAMQTQESFYELYIGTTNRSIDQYVKAGRRKFALKLHGNLAALDVHRGRLATALTTYTSLPAHYAPHKWTSLEGLMLSLALDTHETLQRPKDREWVHVLLSFLASYIDHWTELLLSKEDVEAYMHHLISALRDTASKLEQDLEDLDHPAIVIRMASNAHLQPGRDGLLLDVTITNRLPVDIQIDQIRVILIGGDNARLHFSGSCGTLKPGRNETTLHCSASSPGTYLLGSSEISMDRIVFKWVHRKDLMAKSSKTKKLHLVRIPKDHQALTVEVRQPKKVVLGEPSSIQIVIKTGRNDVEKMSVRLTSPLVVLYLDETTLDRGSETQLDKTSESLKLQSIGSHQEIVLHIPHADQAAPTMKVTVNVEYTTKSEPTVSRDIAVTQSVLVSLPISVNVEDFFRGSRLFSRFTVSTTSHQHVRIASTVLQCDGDLKIVSCNSKERGILSVTPSQPAHFLFYIDSTEPVRKSLRLQVRYRMLREEVHALIDDAVSAIEDPSQRSILTELVVQVLESDASWIEQYGITGEIVLPDRTLDIGEHAESLERIKQTLARRDKDISATGFWREMFIPVDVPSMNIVASVHLDLPAKTPVYKFYAGQPIQANLSIHTSFAWDSSSEIDIKERMYQMQYDVEEMIRDWLVSGRKRGDFIATHDGIFTVSLTLIALHHGELVLPKVTVCALPMGGPLTMGSLSIPSTETYQNHGAEKILVLPRGGRTTFVMEMS